MSNTNADRIVRDGTAVDRKARGKVVNLSRKLEKLDIVYLEPGKISPNPYNPNRQSQHDFELLCRSMEDDGFCVAVDTNILCADLVWRRAGDLQIGQEIVAFDEHVDPDANYKHGRRYRTAVVEGNRVFEDTLYEVRTAAGDVVRCNAEHPWLVRRVNGPMAGRRNGVWVATRDLLPGDHVVKLVDPWEQEDTYSAGWLSGFLDGEGCASHEATHNGSELPILRLSASQKPGAVADRMVREVASRVRKSAVRTARWSYTHPERNWQDNVRIRVSNIADIMRLLGSVRPERLLTNAGKFWEGRSIATKDSGVVVTAVAKMGVGLLAGLSTSTRTYIAEGYAVHNTQPVIVQQETLQIVDGEHRWRAAQALGYEQIPVVLVDMTAEQMRIATLRHNRARGSEDVELSAQVLRDLRELGALDWAQDSLLLDDSEMQKLLDDIPAPEALAAPSYSEAWAPSAIGTSVHNDVTVEDTGDGIDIRSASKRTAEAVKEAQARIQIAKTQEEKARIQRDLNSFRITTVYMKDEADIVRGVLGEKASDKLLEICTCIHQHGRYPA